MICVHARQSELEKMGASALSHLVLAQMVRIEHLELLVARLQRAHYGPKSEKTAVHVDQLMLGLGGCVIEGQPAAQAEPPPASNDKPAGVPRKSRALAAHLRREIRVLLAAHCMSSCWRGELRKLGKASSEML